MTAPRNDDRRRAGPVRRTFRWCRRSLYVLVLALAAAVLYLNQVGLPEFAKRPLLAQLRERGLDLDFSRMRLRFGRGVVVEHVNVARRREVAGEQFHAEELQLRLRWSALLELRAPEIVALALRDGSMLLPLSAGPDQPPVPFAIEHVDARLRFAGPEHWELESLDASSLGGTFHASGTLTNVSVLRSQRAPRTNAAAGATWKRVVVQAIRTLEHTRFDAPPELTVGFVADLRNPAASGGDLRLRALGASNQWARLEGLDLRVDVPRPTDTNAPQRADLRLAAARASTRWASATTVELDARTHLAPSGPLPDRVEWRVSGRDVDTPWAKAGTARASGISAGQPFPAGPAVPFVPPGGDPTPRRVAATNGFASSFHADLSGARVTVPGFPAAAATLSADLDVAHDLASWRGVTGKIDATGATSRWASVSSARVSVSLVPRPVVPATDASWGPWARWAGLAAHAEIGATNVAAPGIALDRATASAGWQAPALELPLLDLRLGGGTARGSATLDVATRRAWARAETAFDVHRVEPLLTTNASRWLRQFGWEASDPPRLSGEVGVVLPAWTNRHPDWRGTVQPTLTLAAEVRATNAGFRGIVVDAASGRVGYTNRVWSVRGMDVARGGGRLGFDYDGSEETKDYHFRLRALLDPMVALPLLDEGLQRGIPRQVTLGPPPFVEGDIWGRWLDRERTGFDLHVVATNFVVRGEPVQFVDGWATYTNRVVGYRDVRIRSDGDGHVPSGSYDANRQEVTFTNTTSTVPVMRVARVIGPKVTRALSHYVFTNAPSVWLEGRVGIHGTDENDLRLRVAARDFSWWRIGGTNVTADLHLRRDTMTIRGLNGRFYGGDLAGDLFFDWDDAEDVKFRLALSGTNLAMADLLRAMALATNRLEGRLTGRVDVTQGSSADPWRYAGRGRLRIEDGYLWGLPVFGLFSPVFDAVSPGLGQTRFTEGSATFVATNGVLATRDMEMRSATMRLQYRGTVDVAGKLDATMQAELFRDAPLIGRLLQLAFTPVTKLLEYRVRGTVMKPDPEPRYLPRFLVAVLRPISTLKSLLPSEDKPAAVPVPAPDAVPPK